MELIEREQQLKGLANAWRQVKSGKGRMTLVSGEAGIGKTSLTPLISSYRDDEVSSNHPLRFLLGDFPVNLITRIALPLLSQGEKPFE